jgi:hypothetical protein
VGACFGLSCFANKALALNSGRSALRLFAKALSFLGQTYFEGVSLRETASLLHGAAPFP